MIVLASYGGPSGGGFALELIIRWMPIYSQVGFGLLALAIVLLLVKALRAIQRGSSPTPMCAYFKPITGLVICWTAFCLCSGVAELAAHITQSAGASRWGIFLFWLPTISGHLLAGLIVGMLKIVSCMVIRAAQDRKDSREQPIPSD